MKVSNQAPFIKETAIQKQKKIQKGGGFLDGMKRAGLFATALLPFSSRGIIINVLMLPLNLLHNLGKGFAEAIKGKDVKVFGKTFIDGMKGDLEKGWGGGITEFYTSLNEKIDADVKIVNDHLPYAAQFNCDYRKELAPNIKNFENLIVANFSQKLINRMGDYNIQYENNGSGRYTNPKTGLQFEILYDTQKKEMIVSFQGLKKMSPFSSDGKQAIAEFFGGVPDASIEAMNIGKVLKELVEEENNNKEENDKLTPVVIGHSHGGGLAQAAAAANEIKGVVFNSRPMGASVRRYIGLDKIAKNSKLITAFSAEGDFLSRTRIINLLAMLFERILGIPVPHTIGKGYILPGLNIQKGISKGVLSQAYAKFPNAIIQHAFPHEQFRQFLNKDIELNFGFCNSL